MTPWTVACQAPVPWNFPGKITTVAYCFLLTENLSYPGIKLASPALAGGFFTSEPPGKSFIKCLPWVIKTNISPHRAASHSHVSFLDEETGTQGS